MGAKIRVAAIGIVAIAAVLVVVIPKTLGHRLELKTYFENAEGLQPGATVRVAGVDVGRVASVRARPDLRDHAAEVVMKLHTVYELQIPSDAVAVLATDGVLGKPLVNIRVKDAHGPPIHDGAILRSSEQGQMTWEEFMDRLQQLTRSRRDSDED